ncbi:hypothetical protein [Amycolatopsis sp. NPDC051071]|uniref:hypothetical protein n=1 Tax=Amycolatopsis sp. NPDC051071 TaxID=3154637 RepID=UPI0034461AC4
MERDVLAKGLDTGLLHRDDLVAFSMCRAYDSSMAYEFGRAAVCHLSSGEDP